MGQVNSNSAATNALDAKEKIRYQEFVKNYQFLRRIKDPRYGDISVLQDKFTKESVALREIVSKSTKDFDKDMSSLRARYKISHPNIIKVLGYTSKSEDHLCASVHKILMIVEFLDNDLEKEISLKKNHNNYYKEEQLWYLAENIIKALSLLQKNSISHEDIKPSTIFISKMGVYKIAQHNIATSSIPAYHQRLSGATDSRTYLSPELLENLQRYELRPKHNPWKSDVFSFGMTLLHAATLTSCDRLYDWNNQTLDFEELGEKLASLRPRYSESFQDFVQTMLEVADDLRPDFVALETKLQTAQDPNKKLNPTPGHSPAKARRNETSQDVPEDAFEDLNSNTHRPVKGKMNIDGFSGHDNYQHRNINSSTILSHDSRIASIRTADRPTNLGSNVQNPTALQQQNTFVSGKRSPKLAEQPQKTREIPQARIFKDAPASEPIKQDVEVREQKKPKYEKEIFEREKQQQPLKPSKAFILPYSNEFSDSGLNGSTQLTDAIPSINALSAIGRNEDKTLPSSINEIHSLNVIQDQPIAKLQEVERQDAQHGRRKSLISNEVARIISEFRTKMGVQGVVETNHPTQNGREVPANNQVHYQVVDSAPTENNVQTFEYPKYDTFNQQHKDPVVRNLKMDNVPHQSENVEFGRKFMNEQFQNKERGMMAPSNQQISPKANYNLTTNIRQDISPEIENRRISQQFQQSSYGQQNTNPQFSRTQPQYANQTMPRSTQQQQQQPIVQKAQNQSLNSRTMGYSYPNESYLHQTPHERQRPQAYNNPSQLNQTTTMTPNDPYSRRGQLSQQGNFQGYNEQMFGGSPDLRNDNYFSNQNVSRTGAGYGSNDRSGKQQQTYVFTDGHEVKPTEDNRAYNPKGQIQSPGYGQNEIINETYPDGSVYEGEKRNNLRHGKGTFYYSDGGMYTGDWICGSMEGYGVLYYAGGSKAYEGEWREDKFHGKGIVYNEMPAVLKGEFDFTNFDSVGDFWVKYEGSFMNDNKEGSGMLLLSNGERFQGYFKDDMVSGRGMFYTLKGKVVKGEWWQNKLGRTFM